ncbi:unnamed protein product [Menidia menidia]|uniref:(Atlantic silverside) hypothetical protein n=1 Tax=Menidia menidia TaxID=238744 RepID=A0A8S4ADC8_9TELE|nr:unnamed protein product [Menidia menidia]
MNRKEVRGGGSRRGNDTDMRRKEKENRKLQLELSQMRIELQMALDSKDSDIEQLRTLLQALSVQSMDSASLSSGPDEQDREQSIPCMVLDIE